jgi:hypothetical protein
VSADRRPHDGRQVNTVEIERRERVRQYRDAFTRAEPLVDQDDRLPA